jgi:MFS family permease
MHTVGGRTGEAPTTVGAVRLAAAGLAVIAVCYGLARFAYGLFVPAFTAEFGLGATAAGAIASSSYAAYCVAVVAATLATVRWGPRVVATAAGLAAVLGTGLIAIAPGVPVLAVGVVIAGSSTGLASPPLADAVARWVRDDRADRVQTVVNAGTGVGVAVSGPIPQ